MKKFLKLSYVFACLLVAFTVNALAYLDPATTSYIIQMIAGICIAAGATVGIFWKKIRLFFKKKKLAALERKIAEEARKRESSIGE